LIAAILLGAALATAGQTYRQISSLQQFAATYDQYYPPMELSSEGVLSVKGELKAPVRVPALGGVVLVDPTGQTNPETSASEGVFALITDRQVVVLNGAEKPPRQGLAEYAVPPYGLFQLPAKGQVKVIDGTTIRAVVHEKVFPPMIILSLFWAVAQALGEAAWAVAIVFMMGPVIILTAAGMRGDGVAPIRTMILPRRAASRMVVGFLVPLVLAGAILRAVGRPIADVLGLSGAMLFWFGAALGLAVWTGFMAKRMYGVKR
jgi:HAMP domain-containing protein